MEYRSPVYIQNDCSCGYATNNTQNCNQKECNRYVTREFKCAQIEFEQYIKRAQDRYLKRIKASVGKE